jgi:hypothetical protein
MLIAITAYFSRSVKVVTAQLLENFQNSAVLQRVFEDANFLF